MRRRILMAAFVAVVASSLAPQPAMAGCTETYEGCQIVGWQKPNWLLRELKFIECFAEYIGCVKGATGF